MFISFVNKGTQAENWRLKKLVSPEGELSGTEESRTFPIVLFGFGLLLFLLIIRYAGTGLILLAR